MAVSVIVYLGQGHRTLGENMTRQSATLYDYSRRKRYQRGARSDQSIP